MSGSYGSSARPVSLDPFARIVEVGWPMGPKYIAIPFSLTNVLAAAQEVDGTGSCDAPYTEPPAGISLLATYLKTVTYSYANDVVVSTYSATPSFYVWASGSWTFAGSGSPTGMPAAGQVKTCPAWTIGPTTSGLIRWQTDGEEHPSSLSVPMAPGRKFRSGDSAIVDHFGVPFTGPAACYYPDEAETTPGLGTKGAPYTFYDWDTNPEMMASAGAAETFSFSGLTLTHAGQEFRVVGVRSSGDYSSALWLLLAKVLS